MNIRKMEVHSHPHQLILLRKQDHHPPKRQSFYLEPMQFAFLKFKGIWFQKLNYHSKLIADNIQD